MALLIVGDAAAAIQEQTIKRLFLLTISEGESFATFLQFLVLLENMVRAK